MQRTMLFLVRLSVTILCSTIMVVKSEPSVCTTTGYVVWCQTFSHVNDLQGLLTENTRVLMLEDIHGLSKVKSLESPLENADKVTSLLITKNQDVVNIEPHVLSMFSNLQHFGVDGSRWTVIKTGTFSGVTQLRGVAAHFNHVKELQNSAFEGAQYLEDLNLSFNDLLSIPKKAFSGLTNLETLNLRHNQIRSLPMTVFRNLTSLTTLDLSENSLEAIQADLLNPLKKLDTLSLNHNAIAKISGELRLPELRMLTIAHNTLSEFPSGVLDECRSLLSVDLSRNPGLKNLTEQPFLHLTKLKHLMLGGNGASADNFETLKQQALVIV